MVKRKVTLSLDSEIYKQFQKFCEKNDIMLSKRIERIIKKELENELRKPLFSNKKKLDEIV